LLLEYGADPAIENNYGKTPLNVALDMGNDETAWLIAAKIPPEYRKNDSEDEPRRDVPLLISREGAA
jgi:ankyrin repeat protein